MSKDLVRNRPHVGRKLRRVSAACAMLVEAFFVLEDAPGCARAQAPREERQVLGRA